MAGKLHNMPRSKSRIVLLSLSLLALSLLIFLSSLSPFQTSSSPSSSSSRFHDPNVETSFVTSLDHFLTTHTHPPSADDDDTVTETEAAVNNLDDAVYRSEMDRLDSDPYYPLSLPLRVYVYNMPSKFTYDLLRLFATTYKETSNLTSNGSPVHRLIEQVVTVPDSLLFSMIL